jgi:hypothetical protein
LNSWEEKRKNWNLVFEGGVREELTIGVVEGLATIKDIGRNSKIAIVFGRCKDLWYRMQESSCSTSFQYQLVRPYKQRTLARWKERKKKNQENEKEGKEERKEGHEPQQVTIAVIIGNNIQNFAAYKIQNVRNDISCQSSQAFANQVLVFDRNRLRGRRRFEPYFQNLFGSLEMAAFS